MILHEKQRKMAYWLKVILGKSNIDVLAAILIKQGENLIELTTQEVIEQACYLENQKKFKQTIRTLVMQGVLMRELGFIGDSSVCTKILKGTYISLPYLDYYSKLLLKHLQSLLHIKDKPSTILTTDKF